MSSFPPAQPDDFPAELPPMPQDPTYGIPTQIPPDGPTIEMPNPFNTPEPGGEPMEPDEGGEDGVEVPEVEPVVEIGDDSGTTVADGAQRRRSGCISCGIDARDWCACPAI